MFNLNDKLIDLDFESFDTKLNIDNENDLIYLVYIKKCIELKTIFNPNLSEDDFKDKIFETKPIELKHFKKGFKLANKTKDLEFFTNGILNDYMNSKDNFKRILLDLFLAFIKLNNKAKEDNKFNVDTTRLNIVINEFNKYFNHSINEVKHIEKIETKTIETIELVDEKIIDESKIDNIFENVLTKKKKNN